MRPGPATGSRSHEALVVGEDDHHPKPKLVSFSNTSQSLPPGTTYDLDVTLPSANFKVARIIMYGPANGGAGSGSQWHECASVHATTISSEAKGISVRSSSLKMVYVATYSKQNGDTTLTQKIFDSATGISATYIALDDAWITGSTLRLRFHNYFGGSATLDVHGSAELF